MRSNFLKTTFHTAVLAVSVLLLGAGLAVAQTVNLTAGTTSIALPDGTTVPMWGYTCTDAGTNGATCAALNPNSVGNPNATPPVPASWSPVVITVPTGSTLTINLTNSLPAAVKETSLVIVGQLGRELGNSATTMDSPDHSNAQQLTWPIASPGPVGTPPMQGKRVSSFSKPAINGSGATQLQWNNLKPGTYLIETGTHPSIQGPMGLYGVLVVTQTPGTAAGVATGCAYGYIAANAGTGAAASCAVPYDAEIPMLFSEIDPVQNTTVNKAVGTAGFSETAVWSGLVGGCGDPKSTSYLTCYPPAVNYIPLYYLINGVAFNRNLPSNSLFPVAPPTNVAATGSVLVRLVNAGLRMHVPSIVGSQTKGVTAAPGLSLIAEDGNVLPGVSRVQSEVFMAAGKTYDVMVNVPPSTANALPIYDRQLSLSGNAIARDAGMLAYIGINGSALPQTGAFAATGAKANPDVYNLVNGQPLTISDLSKGVIANDVNVYGVQLLSGPGGVGSTVTLNANGTFAYVPGPGITSDSFSYCANGTVTAGVCSSSISATVTLQDCSQVAGCLEGAGGITLKDDTFISKNSTTISISPPGVLANDSDAAGYPLSAILGGAGSLNVTLNSDGSFSASPKQGAAGAACAAALNVPANSQCFTFTYSAKNSQGTPSGGSATVTLAFLPASGLTVKVVDGVDKTTEITDYRWVIEEDRTFYVDPLCTTNPVPAGCPQIALNQGQGNGFIVPTFGTNFHTSYMPVVATGCTGPLSCESGQTLLGQNAVCDLGNGVCRTTATQQAQHMPAEVYLDPNKRYYISVLPGDAANPFNNAGGAPVPVDPNNPNGPVRQFDLTKDCTTAGDPSNPCGHGMGGAPIPALCRPSTGTACATSYPVVSILTQPTPFPPSKLSVFVFEDDFPLNGEQDGGGGIDVLSPNEGGLGGFNITLFDDAGGTGDATGQMTYDMFNMPLSNSLAGTIDPSTGFDACPISATGFSSNTAVAAALSAQEQTGSNGQRGNLGITGTIVSCPKYESDGKTLSPLAGQAVVANLMPGRYGVVATASADRIGRGEEWLQTNTLDGQKAHDSFLRIGEPSFFQEFGPAGYHVSIGFANPAIINARHDYVCNGSDPNITGSNCTNSVTGFVSTERMSRTPDERLYGSGTNDSFSFTQCYVSFGDPDGEDFAFTKCNADGSFTLNGLPDGDWRITVFDQWNDMLVDGLSTPVRLSGGQQTNLGEIAMNQWQSNIYTKTFFDTNGNGIQDPGEDGLTLVATNNRFRDGSYSNFNNTDLAGNAGFNEIFPLFSWYVIEDDTTRYKTTGTHVVYDAGGPADGTCTGSTAPCGSSTIGGNMANTAEVIPLPTNLQVPGARYCASADCPTGDTAGGSSGRVDPPTWFGTEGWQGFSGQNNFVEFGKKPYAPGETGGIHGEVIYASTRPFDDPGLLIHTSWTPDVPGVTINLYQEVAAPDGTTGLHLVDTTETSSWDKWAQGFRTDRNGVPLKDDSGNSIPNMSCPGQGQNTGTNADLFYFTIYNQPMWLDVYGNNGTVANPIPYNSQFKCYDGMHNWNQVQPAPYDGYYSFPSVIAVDPATGQFSKSNCHMQIQGEPWGCVPNTFDANDTFRTGTPMLPPGKYVVEMIVPPGYELVKEEDKNILIGDNYIAPVTQQFAGLGNIFILPDQAEVSASSATGCTVVQGGYQCNPQQSTQSLGRTTLPNHEGDTGSVETFWPCVGAARVVPDFISLFPQSGEVSPFAGATRNLCDKKEVTLTEQTSALAKFWIFTSAHVAAHFTGVITDDYTSEFDPFSPQWGEKFSPANLPVSIKDWTGTEISRVYADQWGTYNGLTYSTWEVNPPNPTGYAPTMMVVCMNDPGPIPDPNNPGKMMTDPLFNPQYSQFCYEIPFMPGQTQYMDTPVVPTSAFAGAGYNNPDCAYPDATPAIKEVDGDGIGPWVDYAAGTIDALNVSASGTNYNSAPFNFNITGNGGTGGTGRVTGLALVSIDNYNTNCTTTGLNRCSLWTANPIVTISNGGGGSGATATASFNASTHVITFTVTSGGSGYTNAPTVQVRRGNGFFGTNITVTSAKHMGVSSAILTAGGTGYTSAFDFTINAQGGSGAKVHLTVGTSVNQTLTITALGTVPVPNYGYAGPSAKAPFNAKTVNRTYSFGGTKGTITIGGVTIPTANVSWGDTSITVSLKGMNLPSCAVQQQAQYGGFPAQCGQLMIKRADNGHESVDTVTVTVGGKAPIRVTGTTPLSPTGVGSIQQAIDAAQPGDLIIVPPGTYNEMLQMWKPVRLQGVGSASSIINANTQPAGKMDVWRSRIVCLFGLALNGSPNGYDPGCGAAWNAFTTPTLAVNRRTGVGPQAQVDRLPLEAAVGWDATQNGNMAELLQEPTLMGALEGAGITVLGKGVIYPIGVNPWNDGAEAGGFPAGTQLLLNVPSFTDGNGNRVPSSSDHCNTTPNPFPSNFECNPSRIDGLTITDSSQGGGGIYVHGWNHNLEIANDSIHSNAGTLSGGINVGQGEHPGEYTAQGINSAPDTCQPSEPTGVPEPYCFDMNVNIHNNYISQNSSTGDELFSATPAGAGGVTICNGSDYYKFNYNWVCGNLSSGDGGGIGHVGLSFNGDIEHNSILFNQSTNPTIPTNGGGLLVMGAPDVDPNCGATTDQDCLDPTAGPSDGIGPNLNINANLIMGNSADSGSGGGLRLQNVNGSEVAAFPRTPNRWFHVTVTNNIIVNNVAGWDGAGVSLLDALDTDIINNTIMSNDTTASAGPLFNTLGAPLASAGGPTQISNNGTTTLPQPAGLVSIQNSVNLTTALKGVTVTCPSGHYGTASATNGTCKTYSYPELYNDLIYDNRSFYIGVGALPLVGLQNQQSTVALYNAFTATAPASQSTSGNCVAGSSYWDIGVRGDTGPTNHASGVTLSPEASFLTNTTGYAGGGQGFGANVSPHDVNGAGLVITEYCNGSRVPPEAGGLGWQVPPGISDATVPNPVFNLTPAATVDEGNNWVNLSWGPLAMTNPVGNAVLGNYGPVAGSPVINYVTNSISSTTYGAAPSTDFFGNPRKSNNAVDVGAIEFQTNGVAEPAIGVVTPSQLDFGIVVIGTAPSPTQTLTVRNDGGANLTGVAPGAFPAGFSRSGGSCNAAVPVTPGNSCTIVVAFTPTSAIAYGGSLAINANVGVNGAPVSLSGTGLAPVRTATVAPASLAFGSWATGTTSNAMTLTVTNTGNVNLTGGSFTFGGGVPQPFSRSGGSCGTTLNVGDNCTITVVFAPTTVAAFTGANSRTLTVAYTGATVTGSAVALTGTGVAARASVSITPNPVTVTVAAGSGSATATVTFTNTAAVGGSNVEVSNVSVTSIINGFTKVNDTCTGAAVAPQASCTVGVRLSRFGVGGANRNGMITFTDTGAGSPQAVPVNGTVH